MPGECREQQFELQAKYSADSPVPESFDQDIGRFMLGPPKSASGGDKAKLKVVLPACFNDIGWSKLVMLLAACVPLQHLLLTLHHQSS